MKAVFLKAGAVNEISNRVCFVGECVCLGAEVRQAANSHVKRQGTKLKALVVGKEGGVGTIYPAGSKKTDESETRLIRWPKASFAMCAWPKK